MAAGRASTGEADVGDGEVPESQRRMGGEEGIAAGGGAVVVSDANDPTRDTRRKTVARRGALGTSEVNKHCGFALGCSANLLLRDTPCRIELWI